MPRTTVPVQTPLGSFPVLPLAAGSADLPMVAADTVNFNQASFVGRSRLMLVAQNTSGTTAYNVTISSAPDPQNRTGDITTYQLDANDVAYFIFERTGWAQVADQMLYFQANNAAIKFGVIGL